MELPGLSGQETNTGEKGEDMRTGTQRRLPAHVVHFFAVLAILCFAAFATNPAMAQIAPPAAEPAAEGPAQPAADASAEEAADGSAVELPPRLLDPEIDTKELDYRLVPLTKEELAALAAEWLAIVKAKTEEVMEAQIAISQTEGKVEEAARDRLTELVAERKSMFDKYANIVSAWEKKGGDEAAIAEYRAYHNAIIVEETRTADFKTLMAQAFAWLTALDGGVQLAIEVGTIVASLIELIFVARLFRRFFRRWIGHVPNLSLLLQAFIVGVIYWIVLAFGLMVVLSALGVDISPVFALIGGASFILAFAFQDTLGNLASGLMIMVNHPFDEGDYVDIGGTAGTVRSVSIVATTVVTPDNKVIVIPNKNVWGNVITNVTASDTRRVDLVFGISYEDSIADALRVIQETVDAHPLVLDEPEPMIKVSELASSSVNIVCRPWAKSSDWWTVYTDLTYQVKERFDEVGITIPYPQQEIHVKTSGTAHSGERSAFLPYGRKAVPPGAHTPSEQRAEAIAAGEEGHHRGEEAEKTS